MANELLTQLGVELSASGVARHHGARAADGILDGWLVDTADAECLPDLEAAGITARAVNVFMRDAESTAATPPDALGETAKLILPSAALAYCRPCRSQGSLTNGAMISS